MTEILNTPSGSHLPVMVNVWNGGLTDPANAVVNEYSVLSIPAFWSGVRFLSETLASLPKAVYKQDGASFQPVTHAQNKLLSRKANQYTTPFVVFETWHSHAIIHGNGYLFVSRDQKSAKPVGYYNLAPASVTPFRFNGAQWYFVKGGGKNADGKIIDVVLPGDDVLHLPGLGYDGMVGYPVVWIMAEALELARNGQRFASRYLKKGTQVQGSIEIPGSATKEQIDAMLDRLRRNHAGIDGDYNYTVLTGGASMKNGTIPPEQSQLLQSRQFAVIDICRILRIPPHIVYDLGKATWGNVENMGLEVVKYSLRAWVEKAEQELSSKLLTDAEQDAGLFIRYSVDALTRGDTTTQTTTTLALVNGGLITANEGRGLLNRPPSDDPTANKLRIPVNFPVAMTPSDAPLPAKADDDDDGKSGAYAAIKPIITATIARIEHKTAKAFEGRAGKELTVWGNLFANTQAGYVQAEFTPLAASISELTGKVVDVERIAARYATAIRMQAAGHERKSLELIVTELLEGKSNGEQT